MIRGKYKRTEEIKNKQSKIMRERSKHVDQDAKVSKWRESIKKSKVGRKPKREPENRSCPNCGKQFMVKTGRDFKKVYCKKECYYESKRGIVPIDPEIVRSMDRSYMRTEKYAAATCNPDTPEYKRYKNKVGNLTEKTYKENIDIINPNRYTRTIAGVENGWQLDHIKPVRECFDQGLSPEEASSLENLRMLPWKENLMRNYR